MEARGATSGRRDASGRAPRDLNALPLPDLFAALTSDGCAKRLIEIARDEDLGMRPRPARAGDEAESTTTIGDVTTRACISPEKQGAADLVAREAGEVAGLAAMPMMLDVFGGEVRFEARASDGDRVAAKTIVGVLRGPMDEILELERTMLNLVGRLSGIATRTAKFVQAMTGGGPVRAKLYDTRKTTPGLRAFEKYAVRCGGGMCHRIGLYDAMLIKDNHLAGVGVGEIAEFVAEASRRAREEAVTPLSFVEVEVDSLDQFRALLTLPAGIIDIVLLDNMGPAKLREAVAMRDAAGSRIELEASGGINLETIRGVAETGVDRISTGSLTHSAASLDVALDVEVGR